MTRAIKGFTLIELIVVIIIISILVAVAFPTFGSIKARAIATEAIMGIAAIRQVVRQYSMEYSEAIEINLNGPSYTPASASASIKPNDFEGIYFSKECYSGFKLVAQSGYGVCYFNPNQSSKKDMVNAMKDGPGDASIKIDESGKITQSNFSRSGYPPS